MRTRLLLAALLLTSTLAVHAQMTSLTVNNFDFEDGGLADGGYTSGATGTIPTSWDAIPGNAPSGGYYGYFNPQDSAYAGTTGTPGTIGTMSGPNIFYFGTSASGEGIQQTLGSNFDLNTSYQLTVSIGCRGSNTYEAEVTLELLAGSTVLSQGTFLNSNVNTFADSSVTYTGGAANASLVGLPLTVRLSEYDQNATVTDVDIDNVRVTATNAAPEPSTFAWLTLGTVLLIVTVRWRNAHRA